MTTSVVGSVVLGIVCFILPLHTDGKCLDWIGFGAALRWTITAIAIIYLFTCRFSLLKKHKKQQPQNQNHKTTTRQPFQAVVRPVMRIQMFMEDSDCDRSVVSVAVDAAKDGSDREASESDSDSQTTLILDPVPRKKPKLWFLQEGQ